MARHHALLSVLSCLIISLSMTMLSVPAASAADDEATPSPVNQPGTTSVGAGVDQSDGNVHTAEVLALDGTRIDLAVDSHGQAIAVAWQAPDKSKHHKKRKHNLVENNPVDEPLSSGLVNESDPPSIEDAMPQVSNDTPR